MKYLFGEFQLNPATRELLRKGQPVALRPRSLECLVYLIEHRDRAVGRDELVSAVWGKVEIGDTVVAQTLLRARKALDDTGSQQGMIRTLPRFGYRWVAPVRELAVPTDAHGDRHADGERAVSSAEGDSGQGEPALPAIDLSAADGAADAAAEARIGPPATGAAAAADIDGRIDPVAITDPIERVDVARAAPPRRPVLLRVGLVVLVVSLLVAVVFAFVLQRRGANEVSPAAADDAVLVMPVTVIPEDSENAWVRLGAMDYMAARLRASGINVMPSEQALRLDAAMTGDPPEVARKELLALSGARWIALPEMHRQRDGWAIRMRIVEAGGERMLEARGQTALGASADAADAWLRQLGEHGKAGPRPGPLAERLHRIDAEILAGRLTEARRLVRSASPAERDDPAFLLREAKLEHRVDNLDTAYQRFQDALDRSRATDIETRVSAIMGLGSVESARNDPKAAAARYTQALSLVEALPPDRVNSRMMGLVYQGRGIARARLGDLDAGATDMGQARVWLQRSGDLISLGALGHNLGKVEVLRGNYLQALRELDRSIATFERYRVHDYLARSLSEKAEVQLALARPAEAGETIARVSALLPKLESDRLVGEMLLVKARVQIALGQLRGAGETLAASQLRGVTDADPVLLDSRLRLLMARGEFAQARLLAANGIDNAELNEWLLLTAVQAAIRGRDLPLAKAWLSRASASGVEANGDASQVTALAGGLIHRAAGESAAALAQAEQASRRGDPRVSPDSEIQAGVLRAMVLLDTGQHGAASAIMGELEKYSESDYRVAWLMARLYRSLGDAQAAATAGKHAQVLAGERDIALEPVL